MTCSSCSPFPGTSLAKAAGRPREILALTGLRALAALWVILFHLRPELKATLPGWERSIDFALMPGYLGVDLFFVLSGFIISYNYAGQLSSFSWRAYTGFLWARLSRLYPVHIFTLFILVILVGLAPWLGLQIEDEAIFTLDGLLRSLVLCHGWTLPIEKHWNIPSWSISAEWAALFDPRF